MPRITPTMAGAATKTEGWSNNLSNTGTKHWEVRRFLRRQHLSDNGVTFPGTIVCAAGYTPRSENVDKVRFKSESGEVEYRFTAHDDGLLSVGCETAFATLTSGDSAVPMLTQAC